MIRNRKVPLLGLALCLTSPLSNAVEFGVFGDVSYQGTTEKNTADSFVQGQFDLYATQKIDPMTKVFVEIVYEDGGHGYGLDVERLNIMRMFTPAFSVGVGRFHTPIGYWNTAYHHGALIQDTVLRPTFLDFEDGSGAILPTHIVGVMAGGKFAIAGGDIDYDFMLGNGSSIDTSGYAAFLAGTENFTRSEIDVNNVQARNDKKMIGAKLTYKLSQTPMEIGVFALHDPFAESAPTLKAGPSGVVPYGADLISMRMVGGHIRYANHGFDALGESYNISNDGKFGGTGKHKASAYFVQFGYRITDRLKPIYRYENVDFEKADPYFAFLGTQEGGRHVVDLRYDVDDTNALKFEVARFEPANSGVTKSYTFYALQWAFMML